MAGRRGGRVKVYFEGDNSSLDRASRGAATDLEKVNKQGGRLESTMKGLGISMGRFSTQSGRASTSARKTATDFDRQRKGTLSLNESFKSAAKGAAAFVGAYVGFSAVEDAVTTTLDLGKATDRLSTLTGLSNRTSSEWLEIAKQRKIESKQLVMAFTVEAKAIKSAIDGSSTQLDIFKSLGITQQELKNQNFQQTLLDVADGLQKLGGGYERANAISKLFGRSSQTLASLFSSGSKGIREQLGLARQYGASLDKNAVEKVKEAADAQRRLGLAFDGLKIKVALALFDAGKKVRNWVDDVKNARGSIGRLVNDIGRIMGPVLKPILTTTVGLFRGMAISVKGIAEVLDGALHLRFSQMWKGIKDIFRGGKEAVVGIVNGIIDVINIIPGVPDIGHVGGGGGRHSANTGGTGGGGGYAPGKGGSGRVFGPSTDNRYAGGAINRPMAIVGEEAPQHPEWVIATNPRYREANRRYWMQAGHDLGMPGFGIGGSLKGLGESAVGAAGSAGSFVKGLPGKALGAAGGLASKGADYFINKLPTPHLPNWLGGLGGYLISHVADWIKDKVTSIPSAVGNFVIGSGSGPPGFEALYDRWQPSKPRWDVWQTGLLLQKMGFLVSENPHFGGVSPVHRSGSYHYSGRAIDVNTAAGGSSELARFLQLAPWLSALHPKDPLIEDAGGSNQHLHFAYRKGGKIGAALSSLVGGNFDRNEAATLAHIAGMSSPGLMGAIAQAESTGVPGVVNSIGATGLWQIYNHPDLVAKYGDMRDPWNNARAARDLQADGGLAPWAASRGAWGAKGSVIASLAQKMRRVIGGGSASAGGGGGGHHHHAPPAGGATAPAGAAHGPTTPPSGNFPSAGGVGPPSPPGQPVTIGPHGIIGGHHGPGTVSGLGLTPLPPGAENLPANIQALLQLPGIGYAAKIGIVESAIGAAAETPGTADDATALGVKLGLLRGNKKRIQKKINEIARKLRQPGLTAKERARLIKQENALLGTLGTVQGDITSTRSEISGLSEETGSALNENLEKMNGLLAEQVANQQALYNTSQSQYGVLAQAIAAVASGQIGGQVGLGFSSPATPGSFASY